MCSSPTGYYDDHRGIPIFNIPAEPQAIVQKWKRFRHRDGIILNIYLMTSLLNISGGNKPKR